jgi:hypothetical protein
MRFGVLCALLLSAAASAADAPAPTDAPLVPKAVNVRSVPDKATLGENFEVEVVLTHEKSQRYDLDTPASDDTFDVVSTDRNRVDGAQDATTTFRIKLAAFALGEHTTPTLKFTVTDGARTGTTEVKGAKVTVTSSLPKDAEEKGADLFDIRPPKEIPIPSYRLLWGLLGTLAAAAIAYLLWRQLKKPKAQAALPPPKLDPLDVRTRKKLDALAQEDLPGKGKMREYWFRLSEIVRGYMGERYAFDALECTTPELLSAVRKLHTPGLLYAELEGFCLSSDLARYAKAMPTPEDCKKAIEFGYRLVEQTALQTTTPNAPTVRVP